MSATRLRAGASPGGPGAARQRIALVGAHVLGANAGEVIHELALAIHDRKRLSDLGFLVRSKA